MNLFTLFQEKLDLSPRVAAAYKEVSNYQDLLLLGDLATIKSDEDTQVLCLPRSRAFSLKKS